MKLTIHIHHCISLDQETRDFLESLFPDSEKIKALTERLKEKTAALKDEVVKDTPTS